MPPSFERTHANFLRQRYNAKDFIQKVNPEDPQLDPDELDEVDDLIEMVTKFLRDFQAVQSSVAGNPAKRQICIDSIDELESLKDQLEYIKDKDEQLHREAVRRAR
ncbi:hypothetical protein F5Y04DRAFT_284164 [Hypomontagnella monticulosa]|nr:hypothetical protein F5Y04DRAFT_284164 [Hypomontagnella monticulosa]